MDTETAKLLSDIKAFIEKTGISPSYFGQRAAHNQKLIKRLEAGGTVTLVTASRIRAYMAENTYKKKNGK